MGHLTQCQVNCTLLGPQCYCLVGVEGVGVMKRLGYRIQCLGQLLKASEISQKKNYI